MQRFTLPKAFILPLLLAASPIALTACETPPNTEVSRTAPAMTITGSATYLERMAAPAGSVLKVELHDVSLADAPSVVLTDWTANLDEGGVPRTFILTVPQELDNWRTYSVRAYITDNKGALLWTTDTAHTVQPGSTFDLGELVMIQVTSPEPASGGRPFADTEWLIETMGGTAIISGSEPRLRFDKDGRISGTTGCNRFFGTYSQDENGLTFSGVGMTRMACLKDGLMEQEATFTSILSGKTTISEDAFGNLTIRGKDGISFTARRLTDEANTPPPDPARLTGAAWQVEDINRGGIIDNTVLTMSFHEDGHVSGSTGCNSFSGPYTVIGNTIRFGDAIMTQRACIAPAPSEQESRFVQILQGDVTWRLTPDGALELTREGGHRLLLRR